MRAKINYPTYVVVMLLVFFLNSICISSAIAQQNERKTKVTAQVLDSATNKGVAFATLSILKIPENTVYHKMITQENGKFSFNVSNGEYKLQIYSLGYAQKEIKFTANEFQENIDLGAISMSVSSTTLDAVDIVAEKPLVTVEPDKILYNTESDPDSKTSNLLEMLRKVPLVSVDGEDNVQLKGSSNFKFHLNGKPSTMLNSNSKDFLKSMPASTVKNIEIITSPGAKYDAEGVNGIINIVTEKKSMNGYSCSVNLGVNSLGDANGGTYVAAALGKLVFSTNLYLNSYSQPWNDNLAYRENQVSDNQRYMTMDGRSKFNGFFPWNSTELSYEIDSLNFVSASFNYFNGTNESQNLSTTEFFNVNRQLTQSYKTFSDVSYDYGDIGGNIDYQRNFKRNKEQILTLSYKFSSSPYSNNTETMIDSVFSFPASRRVAINETFDNEHTYQLDYVQPLKKIGKLETGVKYIQRNSASDSEGKLYVYNTEEFINDESAYNEFDYNQDISAAYLSHIKKFGKFGISSGIRVENSFTKGDFKKDQASDFTNSSLEWVPSVSLSYNLTKSQNLKLAYNKRIKRPFIWYLNPYVYDSDPKNISQGNPDLDPEHFHNFELSYSIFFKLGNVNVSTSYSTADNGIDRVVTVKGEDVIHSTFGNIAEIESYTENLYMNLRFGKKLSFNTNLTAIYSEVNSKLDDNLYNDGWGYRSYGRLQYTIFKSLRASVYGGYYKQKASLQSKYSGHDFSGINVSKTFIDDKLTFSVSVSDFFRDEKKWEYERWTDDVYQKNTNYRIGRHYRFNISYRFGELNKQVKKARRGIRNDDKKEGGENNNSGGN